MATKLSSITSQYRSFIDDQVLTADQLNTLIGYFEDQGRLTRICLNGVGIVCGLKINIGAENEITVTQGCGVTTDGDLVRLLKPVPESTEMTLDIPQIRFTHYKTYEDEIVKYPPFIKNQVQIPIFELIPEFGSKDNCFPLNTLSGAEKMVALLYLEEFQKAPELCTSIDCNNQGIEEISRIKVLLASESDAETIANTDPIYTKHHIILAYQQLPELAVQRVLLTGASATSQSNLLKSFHSAISTNNTLSQLKEGITILFKDFSGFLNVPAGVTGTQINVMIDQLLGFSAQAIPFDVQYRYDLLKDLVDTYAEIKSILLDLGAECCPPIQSFPKHLMLGKLDEPIRFRHSFYKSPVSGEAENVNIKHFNSLIYRFYLMLAQYKISGDEVRITPSRSKDLLSNRSIPFYYTANTVLIDNWDFEKTQRLAQKTNLAYDRSHLSGAAHIQNPLKFNLDAFDFFRVEGLLGKSSGTAEPQLTEKVSSFGLDFDYTSFDIDANQSDLQLYINKNSSLEHFSGVPKNGTLVALKKSNLIIADFALAYKHRTEQGESCCKISECSYPWISSLKYLNNLSRGLKGTQSRTLLMPQAYRLFITQYSINGVSLITQPVEISVPLADIFNGRVHAVTRKLNERFPTGLVFDFDQESKLLKIKKLKEDTFIFSVRDITLSNNSPIYAFTEKSMLKNGRILQSKAIVCTDVNLHQKSFYEQLHSKYDPKNKDDDYGQYDKKWQLWAGLIKKLKKHKLFKEISAKRFPLAMADLPKEVQSELWQIRADISQTAPNTKAWLSGEWTAGAWVNQNMITYYDANRKNTHDDIVLFMQLREKLHQRTGKSKYTIFIDPVTDAQIKALQTKYLNKVDFYVGKAEGTVIGF